MSRASETYALGIFDLLEHWTPDQRARVFFEIENRWCWQCGRVYEECEQDECGDASDPEFIESLKSALAAPREPRLLKKELESK